MAGKSIGEISAVIKGIIDRNGPSFLTDEPYRVYEEIVGHDAVDKKTAAAILHLLVSDAMSHIDFTCDAEQISRSIKMECSLNKRMSDRLALIMTSLNSGDNRREWNDRRCEGLKGFLGEEFVFKWKGYAVWDAGNGTVDCHYEAEIILMPNKGISNDKKLSEHVMITTNRL